MGIEVDGANQKLILDSDGDTYLEAATDDTIKVYISGAHDATISANAINILSGTTLTIDSGANECLSNEFYHEVQCNKNEIYNVKKKLEKNINNFLSTEIEWVPLNKVELSSVEKDEIINFLGTLDDDDDVQNVYTNAKL